MIIIELWLPILVSAAVVWFASAVVWMVMPWHKTDFRPTDREDAVRDALRGQAPGTYMFPHCADQANFKYPEVQQKFIDGPVGYVTIVPSGLQQMGGKMLLSFVFYLIVGLFVAHIVAPATGPESNYMVVFHFAALSSFMAYGLAFFQDSVWFGRPWSTTFKYWLDALIYGLLTGGVFGWLA